MGTSSNRGGIVRHIAGAVRAGGRAFSEALNLSQMTREIGIPGGVVGDDGLTHEEYNPDLQGAKWFGVVDEMLVAFPQAAIVELCWCLPVQAAEWQVTGGSAELRDLVHRSLFTAAGMSTTWSEVIYDMALSAMYGTALFEIVWGEMPDGSLGFRRLVDRDVASIDRYEWDSDGGLAAVVQKGTDPRTDKEVEVKLPIEKCLLFPFRSRRRDLNGRSVLRPMYRYYRSLDMSQRFADIGLDKSLVGQNIGEAAPNAKPSQMQAFLRMLKSLRRHEAAGIVLPHGWALKDKVGTDKIEFLPYIQWLEGAALRTGLSGFVQMGSTNSGTTEFGGSLIDWLVLGLEGLAGGIADRINRHGVRRLVDANAVVTNEDDYPTVTYRPIREMLGSGAAAFAGALVAGEVPVNGATRDQKVDTVRAGLGLDKPTTDAVAGTTGASAAAAAPATATRQAGEAAGCAHDHHQFAEPKPAAGDWEPRMYRYLDVVLSELLAQVRAADGDPVALAQIAVPEQAVADGADLVAEWLAETREAALMAIEEERGVAYAELHQIDPTDAERGRALAIARHLADEARTELSMAALAGRSEAELVSAYAQQMSSSLSSDLHDGAVDVTGRINRATQ